jgi:hypothetical protein
VTALAEATTEEKLKFFFELARLWNRTAVDHANSVARSRQQEAAIQLLAPTYAVAFAIEELLKGSHLFAAELLQRPLLERIGVLNFLQFGGEGALAVWERGWLFRDRERPGLEKLLEFIPELSEKPNSDVTLTPEEFRKLTINRLHSLVHADPIGALRTMKQTGAPEEYSLISGPMNDHPERANEVGTLTVVLISSLIKATERTFPLAPWPLERAAKLVKRT